jgi:hypothetical protein
MFDIHVQKIIGRLRDKLIIEEGLVYCLVFLRFVLCLVRWNVKSIIKEENVV